MKYLRWLSRPLPACGPSFAVPSALFLASVLAAVAGQAEAQVVRDDFWVTNGVVSASALSGNTLYIGGYFSEVGRATGGGVPLGTGDFLPLPGFPRITGGVSTVVSDGADGWYVGGSFTAVGGVPRSNLAHILSDMSVSSWNPGADFTVAALAVEGGIVYAGGGFNSVGGQARSHLAAIDATSGAITAWNPNTDRPVQALAVRGGRVYVGGYFNIVRGQTRNYLAAVDAVTGNLFPWNPNPDFFVTALAARGGTVYVGGQFFTMGG
jgi:hypothetical protein